MSSVLQVLRSSTAAARPTGRQPGELYVNFADGVMGYIDAAGNAQDIQGLPPVFSATATYATGDRVIQDGIIYEANTAVTAKAFAPAEWDLLVGGGGVTYAAAAPTGPATGDLWYSTVAPVGMYVYTGAAWIATTPAPPPGMTSGPTFPATPSANDQHYLTVAPVGSYIYYDDGTSQQWVQQNGTSFSSFHDPAGAASWTIVGDTLTCWGTTAPSTNGATITFPKTFATAPVVMATPVGTGSAGTQGLIFMAATITASDFVIQARYANSGGGVGIATQAGMWHASGQWDGVS